MSSTNPYRMSMFDEYDATRRRRKRIIISAVSATVVVLVIIVAVCASRGKSSAPKDETVGPSEGAKIGIKAVCDGTVYPQSCYDSLVEAVGGSNVDLHKLFQLSLQLAMGEVTKASTRLDELESSGGLNNQEKAALSTCKALLTRAYDRLNDTSQSTDLTARKLIDDFKTWLSASLTYQDACQEGFQNSSPEVRDKVGTLLLNSTQLSSNSLAILTHISKFLDTLNLRKLLQKPEESNPPAWVDRELVEGMTDWRARPDFVVAKDGTGKFLSIGKALEAVKDNCPTKTVIYVKAGIYTEKVVVGYSKWNVVMVGDGPKETVITGSLNVMNGTPMPDTATFTVLGRGFMAVNITFQNTAGAMKQQALAISVDSDQSVFYLCRFDAYQDTLYAFALRQFYRNCDILGTVDFIYGDASAIFQNCKLSPRTPLQGQPDVITANGRTDPNQNTGFSFLSSEIVPLGDLTYVQVYLGRPWRPYSRTIFIKTYIPSVVVGEGWLGWSGKPEYESTSFYGEFQNTGPGSGLTGRVKWKGIKSLGFSEASGFTVGSFIGGGSWIPATGVPYVAGL